MKPPPKDWPRISTSLFYDDAAAAIDWLCDAFGFEVRLRIEGEDGRIEHSQLIYGGGLVMVSTAGGSGHRGASFEACRFLIDRLKSAAPIWKQEQWADGTSWSAGTAAGAMEDQP